MANLRKWSQTATGNATVAGGVNTINFAEGQSPGSVNNSARELMAQIRSIYTPDEWGWVEHSATAIVSSQTVLRLAGNQTANWTANRRWRLRSGSTTRYGTIVSSSFTSETTITVTVDSGSLSASHSLAALASIDSNHVPRDFVTSNSMSTAIATAIATVNTSIAAVLPPGVVMPYAGLTEPSGWLFCFGQAVSRATYSTLFAIVSTTYGVGDGATTFNLPDLRGRVVAGQDDMGGSSANRLTNASGGLDGDTLGATGGSETHTLTTAEIAAHEHFILADQSLSAGGSIAAGEQIAKSNDTGGALGYSIEGTGTTATIGDTSSTGGGTAHNNVQPTIILNYIIRT
jgi:microcystin-dependent protein